jgi:flagellar hook-associated protein 3 FlgL
MSTRITNSMVSQTVLNDVMEGWNRLSKTQEKLASGKELNRPSDDPFQTSRALQLSNDLEGVQQFQRNVDDGISWQQVTETALSSINDSVTTARTLVVQAVNGAASQSSRSAIADQIDQLIEAVKGDANAQVGGRYVLSGTKTTTAPYITGGSPPNDAYQGDANGIYREIGPNVSVQINATGSTLLGSGATGDGGVISMLRGISARLRSGTTADLNTLRSTDMKALDTSLDSITQTRAVIGATTNRLTTAQNRLAQIEESTTTLLSNTTDADMAKTMIDFTTQQSAYQSALRAGASIVQASLLDFLR